MEGEQQLWAFLLELLVCFRGTRPPKVNLENAIPDFHGLQSVLILLSLSIFCLLVICVSFNFNGVR